MDNETHSFEFGKTQNEDAANNDKGEDLQKKKKNNLVSLIMLQIILRDIALRYKRCSAY